MKSKPKFIYLDVCSLSRHFDEQEYIRIRLETEAINLILSKVRQGIYRLLVSPVHIREIEDISDMLERIELQTLLDRMGEPVKVNMTEARARADELVNLGFGIADAAHAAFAEQADASFISCDDRLVKKCINHKLSVWCGNPVVFCEKEGLR
jgi:predicted nucleic acid-binding protein